MDPIAGESAVHELELRGRRLQEVAFVVAKATLDGFLTDDADQSPRPWLFPQLIEITKRWIAECVYCKNGAFPQMLLPTSLREEAASKIYSSIVVGTAGQKRLMPILRPYDPVGSTNLVGFNTTKNVYPTDPEKCHLNYVVADTKSWEQKMAETLEAMPEVVCYVKNQGLGFMIPYVFEGDAANYMPDFIVRFDDGRPDPLNLIVEVSGQPKKQKQAKVATARDHWVPAINNHGGFGRWAFIEITDPWDAASLIRASIPVTAQAGGD